MKLFIIIFSIASKCFSDLDVPDANHGSWFVNETDDKKAICAHFAFSATVNVTYEKLIHTSDVCKMNYYDNIYGRCALCLIYNFFFFSSSL